jgi:hypothetical protein
VKNGVIVLDDRHQDVAEQLLAYLGKELSPEDRDAFERRQLTDELFSAQVENARFLLLESYSEGSLEPEAERQIRNWVAQSPHAQTEVAIGRTLRQIAARKEPSRNLRRALWILVPLAACLLIAVLIPVFRNQRGSAPAVTMAVNHPAPSPVGPQPEQTIVLVAQRLRGGSPSPGSYRLRPGLAARLQIVLPASHSADQYSVRVDRVGASAPVAQFAHIPVQGTTPALFVEIRLPLGALSMGNYTVAVTAPGDSFRIAFRIVE